MIMKKTFDEIIEPFKQFDVVEAIAIGGSSAAKTSDKASDIDVYVFVKDDIAIKERENIIKECSSKYEVGCEYFGAGDEFFVDKMGQQLDVMYWNTGWFESVVDSVWNKYQASNGYSTAFLYTLNNFKIVYDKNGWLSSLKKVLETDYPEELQKNIIKRNMMLLCDKPFASYYEQIEKAVRRGDFVNVNHRSAAFLASYFDVIFAVNKLLHPGEKRLVQYALAHCEILPEGFKEDVNEFSLCRPEKQVQLAKTLTENLRKVIGIDYE